EGGDLSGGNRRSGGLPQARSAAGVFRPQPHRCRREIARTSARGDRAGAQAGQLGGLRSHPAQRSNRRKQARCLAITTDAMNYTVIVGALMILVTVGVLLFRRPVPATVTVASGSRGHSSHRRHPSSRAVSRHHEGGATLWISALEGAMALVMVLATVALTDA